HLEAECRLLELHLRAGGADRRVRDLAAEGDGGLRVLDGDDLGLGQRARLRAFLERLQREIQVEVRADEAERDAAGGEVQWQQVDGVAAERKPGEAADRQQLGQPQR